MANPGSVSESIDPRGARVAGATSGVGVAMVQGGLGFGLVSVLAYSIWAYRLVPGEAAMYAAIAAVYVGLGGLVLGRLVPIAGAWKRFPLLFAGGFLIYAVCWCAFWFGLRGRHFADFWGAAAGLAGMAFFLQRMLGQKHGFWRAYIVLLIAHGIGYYAGGELYAHLRGSTGRLAWGAGHGLGFGAGLAYLLHRCRPAARPS